MTEQQLAAEISNSVMKLEQDDARRCCLSPTFEVKQENDNQQSEGPMTHSASSSQHANPTIQRIKKEPCDNSLCRQEGNIPEPWKQTIASVPFLGPEVATMTRYPSIIRTSDGASHKVNPTVSPSTTTGIILPSDSAEAYNRSIFAETTAPRNYMTRQSKKRKTKFAPAAKFIHSEPYPHVAQRPRVNEAEVAGGAALDPKIREWKEKQALWQSSVISYDPGFNCLSPRFISPQSTNDIGPFYHERVRYPPMAEDGYFYARENNTVDGVSQSPKGKITASSTVSAYQLRQHENTVTTAGYQAREPVIKDVVSLATTQQQAVAVTNVDKRLVGRHRTSSDDSGNNQAERPDSGESGTSDNDESVQAGKYISDLAQPYINIPDDHQVAHINGLLSLPSNRETRYGITYGELKRRCNPPESLTRVDLVAYVRHSKSSGRNLLDKYGIVSSGNRTSSPTVLSKMCENEARVLGDGILKMNMDYFPGKMLSKTAAERATERTKWSNEEQKREEKEERKNKIKAKMNQIEITRSMLKEIYDLLLSEKDSEEMKKFELASHTFGTANLMSHLTLFDRFFEDYQTNLAKPKKK